MNLNCPSETEKLLEEKNSDGDNVLYLFDSVGRESIDGLITEIHNIAEKNKDDIVIYIQSNGGYCHSALALIDTFNRVENDIVTIVTGFAYSAAALIASSGTKGKRFITKHSELMFHMPRGWTKLDKSDTDHMTQVHDTVDMVLVENTGRDLESVREATRLELFLLSEEAIAFGAADKII